MMMSTQSFGFITFIELIQFPLFQKRGVYKELCVDKNGSGQYLAIEGGGHP